MKCDICDKNYVGLFRMWCAEHRVCFSCINFLIKREIKEKEEWSKVI